MRIDLLPLESSLTFDVTAPRLWSFLFPTKDLCDDFTGTDCLWRQICLMSSSFMDFCSSFHSDDFFKEIIGNYLPYASLHKDNDVVHSIWELLTMHYITMIFLHTHGNKLTKWYRLTRSTSSTSSPLLRQILRTGHELFLLSKVS